MNDDEDCDVPDAPRPLGLFVAATEETDPLEPPADIRPEEECLPL